MMNLNSMMKKWLLMFLLLLMGSSSSWAATVVYKIINNSGNVVVAFSNNSTTVGVHAQMRSPFATNYRFYTTLGAAQLDALNNGGGAAVTDETLKVASGSTVSDGDTLYVRYDYNANHGIVDNTSARHPIDITGTKTYNFTIKDPKHSDIENYMLYHGLDKEISANAYAPANAGRGNFLWKFIGTVAPGYSTPDPYDIKIVSSKGLQMGSNYVLTGMVNKKTFTAAEVNDNKGNVSKNFTCEYRTDGYSSTVIQRFFFTRYETRSTLQIAGANTSFIYQANAGGSSHWGQWFYLSYYGDDFCYDPGERLGCRRKINAMHGSPSTQVYLYENAVDEGNKYVIVGEDKDYRVTAYPNPADGDDPTVLKVPKSIKTPLVDDDEYTYYASSADAFNGTNPITELTQEAIDGGKVIYVRYKYKKHKDDLMVDLTGTTEYNLKLNGITMKYQSNYSSNCDIGVGTASDTFVDDLSHHWTFSGNDPYRIQISNETANYHVTGTSASDSRIEMLNGTNNKVAALQLRYTDTHLPNAFFLTEGNEGRYVMKPAFDTRGDFHYSVGWKRTSGTDVAESYCRMWRSDYAANENSDIFQLELIPRNSTIYTYHIIDKQNKEVISARTNSALLSVPTSVKSPMVSKYHYWQANQFTVVGEGANKTYTLITEPEQTELAGISALGEGVTDIYVTYDVSTAYDLNEDVDTTRISVIENTIQANEGVAQRVRLESMQRGEQTFGKMYLLKFWDGEPFKTEDGADGVSPNNKKAVYPYNCGDANLYVYGEEEWRTQLSRGASTRTRWPWYLYSKTNDPYHVSVTSRQSSHVKIDTLLVRSDTLSLKQWKYYSYLRTYYNSEAGKIITTVMTDDPRVVARDATEKWSEYMVLGTDKNFRLVTVDEITDGEGDTERRTVDSFEQYWKTWETVRQAGIGDKTYQTGVNPDLEGNVYTYHAWAYSRPDQEEKANKRYLYENHYFQTIEMGSTFDLEEVTLAPAVVLVDHHGWEILRHPIPISTDTPAQRDSKLLYLNSYNSPMVEKYIWFNKATKLEGYHKYTLDAAEIPIYTKNSRGKWEEDTSKEGYVHTSTSLSDLPYDHLNQANGYDYDYPEDQMTDLYVTYIVKDEFKNAYDKTTNTSAPYLFRQGDNYAKTTDGSTITTAPSSTVVVNGTYLTPSGNAIDTDMLWQLKRNTNIDHEMGYLYKEDEGAELNAKTLEELEEEYNSLVDPLQDNEFDPYNVQIQAHHGGKYLTTSAIDAELVNDGTVQALTAYTTASLQDHCCEFQNGVCADNEPFTFNNHGNKTAHVTNQTFMVIKDKDGNTRLFPRFDHARSVEGFTSIGAWNSTNENRISDFIPVGHYEIIVRDSNVVGGEPIATKDVWAKAGHPIGESPTEHIPLPADMVRGGCDYVGAFTSYQSAENKYSGQTTFYPLFTDLSGGNPTKVYVPYRVDGTNGSTIFVNSIAELDNSKWHFLMQGMESVAIMYGKQLQDYGKAYEYGWRNEREDFGADVEGLTPAEQSFVDNSIGKKGGFHFLQRMSGVNVNAQTGEMTIPTTNDDVGSMFGYRHIESQGKSVPAYLMSPLNDFRRIAETYKDGNDTGFREGKWLWAFVGTPYKFEIVNREAGTNKRLAFVNNEKTGDYRLMLTADYADKHHYFTMTKFSIQKSDDEEALNSFALQIWNNDSVVHRQVIRQQTGSDFNMEAMSKILGPSQTDIAYCKSTSFITYPWNWNDKKYQAVTVNIYPGTESEHGALVLTKTYTRADRAFVAGDVIDGTDGHFYLPLEGREDGSWKPEGVFKNTVPYDGHKINIPYELRRKYCNYTVQGGSFTVQQDDSSNPTPQVLNIYYTVDTENAPLFISENELSTFRGLDADDSFKDGKKKRDYFYFLDQNFTLGKHLYVENSYKGKSELTRFSATNDPKQLMWYFVGDPYNVRLYNVYTDLKSSDARNFVRHRYADKSHSSGYGEDQQNDNKTYMEKVSSKAFSWEMVDSWVGPMGELDTTSVNVHFRKDKLIDKPFALRMRVSNSSNPTAVIPDATYYYLKDNGSTSGNNIYNVSNNTLEPRMNRQNAFPTFPDSRHEANNQYATLTPLKPTKVMVTVYDPDEPTRKVTENEVSDYYAVTDHFKGVPDNLQRKYCDYWWVSTNPDIKSANMVDEDNYYTIEEENPRIYVRYRETSDSPFSNLVDGVPVLKRDASLNPWYNMNIGGWWAFFNSGLDGQTYAVNGLGANRFNNDLVWFVHKGNQLPNGTEKFRKGMQWALIGDPYNFTLLNNRESLAANSLSAERRAAYLSDGNHVGTTGIVWTWLHNGVNTGQYFLSESNGRRTEIVEPASARAVDGPRRVLPSDYSIDAQTETRNITVVDGTGENAGSGISSITTGDNYAIGSNMYLLSVSDETANNESFDAIVNVYNKLNELVATTGWTELARNNAEWSGSLPIEVRRWGCTYHYWADETMTRYPFRTYDQKDASGDYLVKDGGTVYVTYDYDESLYSSENEYRWVNLFFNWDDEHKEWTNDVVTDKEYTAEYWEYNTETNLFEKRHQYNVMQNYNKWVQHDLYTDTQEGWIESPLDSEGDYNKKKAYAYWGDGQYSDPTDAKRQKWAMIGDPYKFILYNYNRKAEAGSYNSYYLRCNTSIFGQNAIENHKFTSFPLGKENTQGIFWTWKVDGTRYTFAEGDAEHGTTTYGPRAGLPESFYQDYAGAEVSEDPAVKKAGYSIETGYLANCALQCKSLYDKNNLVGTVNGYVTYTHKSLRTTELIDGTGAEAPLTYHAGTKNKFYQYTKDPNINDPDNKIDHSIDYTNNITVVIPGTDPTEEEPSGTPSVTFTEQWRKVFSNNDYDEDGKFTSGPYEGYYVGPAESLWKDRYQEFTTYKSVQGYVVASESGTSSASESSVVDNTTQYLRLKNEHSIEKIKADYEAGKSGSQHIPRFLVMPMAAQAKSITFHLQTDKYSDNSTSTSLRSADNVIFDYTSENNGVGNTLTLPWMMRRQYCDYQFYLVEAAADGTLATRRAENKIDDLTYTPDSPSNTHRLSSAQRTASVYKDFWSGGTDLSTDPNCYITQTEEDKEYHEYVIPESWANKDIFILVKYKPTAEFSSLTSTSASNVKWLNLLNVEKGNMMQYTRSQQVTGTGKDTLNHVTNDYLWAIEGDPYGFKLHNRYAVHGFDGTVNEHWSTLLTTDKVNTTENYNYLDGLDSSGSPKNVNFTYNDYGDPVMKSGLTYGSVGTADACATMNSSSTNAVYEAMAGNYDDAMLIHPVNACINVRNKNGYKLYGSFLFNGSQTGDPVQLNYLQDWEVMRNVYANWKLQKPAAKQFLPYYERAGYVGGLLPEVAAAPSNKAIFDKILAGTSLSTEEYNTAWSLVHNPANLVALTDGYYRLKAYSAGNGVVGGDYVSGYLHKTEQNQENPLHIYSKAGSTSNISSLLSYEGNEWAADIVNKSLLEIPDVEYDPSSVLHVTRDENGYIKMQTQGLVVSGNQMMTEPDEPTTEQMDDMLFQMQDIGQAAFQMRTKASATASTPVEDAYLSCNPNTMKYGLNVEANELNVSNGISSGSSVQTHDTKWLLEPVGTAETNASGATYQRPLKLRLTNFGDDMYYATVCFPFDVKVPTGAYAYSCTGEMRGEQKTTPSGSKYYQVNIAEVAGEGTANGNRVLPAGVPAVIYVDGWDLEGKEVTNASEVPFTIASPDDIKWGESTVTSLRNSQLKYQYLTQELSDVSDDEWVFVFSKSGNNIGFMRNATKDYTNTNNNQFVLHNRLYYVQPKTVSPTGRILLNFVSLLEEPSEDPVPTGVQEFQPRDGASGRRDNTIYDIQGRKVTTVEHSGVYIVNGKKVVIHKR